MTNSSAVSYTSAAGGSAEVKPASLNMRLPACRSIVSSSRNGVHLTIVVTNLPFYRSQPSCAGSNEVASAAPRRRATENHGRAQVSVPRVALVSSLGGR